MSRQDANAAFALTSFLYGGNAGYIEDLQARYEADPTSVDDEWRAFFQSLKDDGARAARGPSWRKRNWPQLAHNELTAALDGDWGEVERAVGDKVKARAQIYANLDPLGLEPPKTEEDLDPRSYGFSDADMDRPIFLDRVLGLEFATLRQILQIV